MCELNLVSEMSCEMRKMSVCGKIERQVWCNEVSNMNEPSGVQEMRTVNECGEHTMSAVLILDLYLYLYINQARAHTG